MFDKLKDAFDHFKKRVFKDTNGDFENGGTINAVTRKRNRTITLTVLLILTALAFAVWRLTLSPQAPSKGIQDVGFGAVVTDDFTDKDNQSALTFQQDKINQIEQSLARFEGTLSRFGQSLTSELENIKKANERDTKSQLTELEQQMQQKLDEVDALKIQLETQLASAINAVDASTQYSVETNQGSTFGQYKLPPRPAINSNIDNAKVNEFQYQEQDDVAFSGDAFDSFEFHWQASVEEQQSRRTTDNYVPTGTFVTAVITGGADANGGVSGQGDTSPIVFQTVNQGVLPNGQASKLKDCTITGAVYGEISSSRGVARTNRMSCIQPNGDILDIPVNATVFNFGRNGIRGTTIMKNGKIVQMAGIAGILQGVGDAGKALAQTTTPTALGPSQSINSDKIGLNLLGSATESVGSKLADYYIKLAELYHPIVEVNPGAIVNIVFLEGFPLDPLLADEYETRINEQREQVSNSNQLLDVITNVPSLPQTTQTAPINPLAQKITQQGLSDVGFGREE
ncbi:TrbI/VirB10 family protein [Vibrio crassostreae]|uniref:TrbI/VirB10 family protein n=1 Tax=Vibrio crassostreae TaxID=246167 RepID=UPI001B307CFD|nr:TrbI/VirB10 family protein [Vibrio crassostreae]CAK3434881.1 conjugal transfer pilus assembly protein TraB [Vibrio crassostreae]CAK3515417.1 conjugal transfer pilus assembly protein TraB [Vibrio crassostreae]CAK3911337.1 conjugal transfer pilus assembly protein TraB [Vibrio crassostreae]